MKELQYPLGVETIEDKLAFFYKAQETLRLEHNSKGEDYKNGLITKKQWEEYIIKEFNPKQESIVVNLVTQREMVRKSTRFAVNLNNLVSDKDL